MEAIEQAAAEKRVQELLIAPLEEMGLGKPSTILRPDWPRSKPVLCQKLAYMTEAGLVRLREWVETHPSGPGKDRFPIPLHIMKRACEIEEPDVGPSPFITGVFKDRLGSVAIKEGWAPELLKHVRAHRGDWPGAWTVTQLKKGADNAMRRLPDIEMRMARGDDISKEDAQWRDQRRAAIQRCQDIADQARGAA